MLEAWLHAVALKKQASDGTLHEVDLFPTATANLVEGGTLFPAIIMGNCHHNQHRYTCTAYYCWSRVNNVNFRSSLNVLLGLFCSLERPRHLEIAWSRVRSFICKSSWSFYHLIDLPIDILLQCRNDLQLVLLFVCA